MPEILRLRTAQFEFSVWCNGIAKRQQVYLQTLSKRDTIQLKVESGQGVDIELYQSKSLIRLSPSLLIEELVSEENETVGLNYTFGEKTAEIKLDKSLFFENVQYQFEWVFF